MQTDLSMWAGDSRSWVMSLALGSAPYDLTDAAAMFTVRHRPGDADPLAEIAGEIVDPPTAGKVRVTVPSAISATLPTDDWLAWDLQTTKGGVTRTVPAPVGSRRAPVGVLRVWGDVTR
jgi:hypothetical protein